MSQTRNSSTSESTISGYDQIALLLAITAAGLSIAQLALYCARNPAELVMADRAYGYIVGLGTGISISNLYSLFSKAPEQNNDQRVNHNEEPQKRGYKMMSNTSELA